MPRTSLAGPCLAVLLALTACSPSAPDQGAPADAGGTTSPATGPSGTPGPAPSDRTDAGTFSPADLAGILGTLSEADGAPLQVIPADRIDQSMAEARRFLESVTITPEECAVFVSNSLEAPEGAAYSTAVSTVNGDAVQTVVTASSSADAAQAASRTEAAAAALGSCSSFSLEAQGVAIEQTVEAVDATTAAETTFGTVTVQSSSDGAKQQTMSLVGTRGGLAVTAVRTAQDALPAGTQAELQALVDQTFAAAKG